MRVPAAKSQAPEGFILHDELLPSGLRLLVAPMPGRAGVAAQIWVAAGSNDEAASLHGAAHLIEHLRFKGNAERGPRDLVLAVERHGGQLDAFTEQELTSYHAMVPGAALGEALEVLALMIARPSFDPVAFRKEKQVVMEEIRAVEDDPEEVAAEALWALAFPDHPLGRPIAGTLKSVREMGRDPLVAFAKATTVPHRSVLAIAGGVGLEEARQLAIKAFGSWEGGGPRPATPIPKWGGGTKFLKRDTSQAHVQLGYPAFGWDDPRRHALAVLTAVVGLGMGSWLFQEVREARGLAYHVSAAEALHRDAGLWNVAWACTTHRLPAAIDSVYGVLAKAARGEFKDDEVAIAIQQLIGEARLGDDRPAGLATRLGVEALALGKPTPIALTESHLRAVGPLELAALARQLLSHPRPALAITAPWSKPPAEVKKAIDRLMGGFHLEALA